MKQHSSATLMTTGPIWKRIIAFAVPLFFGNLFQQLYNTADSLIVGNFLGSSALAAVSSSGNLIFLLVGFFNGIAIGSGVVVAKYFGAGKFAMVKRAIHTITAFGLLSGMVLTVVGILAAPQILILMGTPAEVLPNSVTYFRIYFAGSLAFVMYNFLVGILQSVGDSRHPLIYLMISSVINIVLDLTLVAGFHFGVGAAALATVISQVISALLCLRQLLKSPAEYRLEVRKIRLDGIMLRHIISNGLPAGLQNSIISLANVVVQSNINKFGAMAVAGCGSYSKIEGFGFLPITCFALALTTFIGQNLGAKEYDRAKKGAVFGVVCSLSIAELVGIGIYLLSPYLIAGFNDTPQVISYGTAQAHTVTLFYFLLAFSHCMAGILRGAGKSAVPMFVMLICWCIIRVSYITIAVNFIHDIRVIFWAYPITWTLSSITFLIYFLKSDWLHAFEKRAA
ncbi:MAG TPA: MATE family efflux transporter [Candidatus Blautia merdavium]|uniref:Probable multidrug resistance protein NorM n=1 Tax=Candidatus Blautia merdavium TaxID=2838494 RepID=A0A9D2PNK9_9FIRM|nr:MATE family efflux transporter [Candidatus Blautia merdavium]